MQQGIAFSYAAWYLVMFNGDALGVRAPFYAQTSVADFIGTTPHVRVTNLDMCRDELSACAQNEPEQLERIALVKFEVWNPGQGSRPVQIITLAVPSGVSSVKIRKRTGRPGASSFENLTPAGFSWTIANDGIGQQVALDTIVV